MRGLAYISARLNLPGIPLQVTQKPAVPASGPGPLPGAREPLCAALRPEVSQKQTKPFKAHSRRIDSGLFLFFLTALLRCNLQFRHLHSTGFAQSCAAIATT